LKEESEYRKDGARESLRESRANIGIVTIYPCRHLHGIQARLVTSLGKQSECYCGVECIGMRTIVLVDVFLRTANGREVGMVVLC
jgi:hypothetical protein